MDLTSNAQEFRIIMMLWLKILEGVDPSRAGKTKISENRRLFRSCLFISVYFKIVNDILLNRYIFI